MEEAQEGAAAEAPEETRETLRLRLLIAGIIGFDTVQRVRLLRMARQRYLREHADAAQGKAQAAGMNRKLRGDVTAEFAVTFVKDMAGRLGVSERNVENLIAIGKYVPNAVLKEIGKRQVKAVGILLGELTSAYRKADGEPVQWEDIVRAHVDGPPEPRPNGHTLMTASVQLMSMDSRVILPMLVEKGYTFDHINTDPPYGIRRKGAAGEIADDREGSLWCVPLLARLIKPSRALCLWTSSGVWAKWARALVDEGLVLADIITWDKLDPYAKSRTDEMLLVASRGGLPATYNDDTAKTWEVTGVPKNDPVRLLHPTPKPVSLMARALAKYSKPGDVVLDGFAGTGPVGVAAVRMNRNYVGYEAEPTFLRYARDKIGEALDEVGEVRPRRKRPDALLSPPS